MHHRLNTYRFDNANFIADKKTSEVARKFVEKYGKHISRYYPADYSKADVKSILTMFGFSFQYVRGSGFPSKYEISELTCYDKDIDILTNLVDSITKGDQ